MGRVRGTERSFYGKYEGLEKTLPNSKRPPLPPGVSAGGHGGSHGYLMNEFVTRDFQDRKPLVDVAHGIESDGGGNRCSSVGAEGRRATEDSAV